jgi:hypothetical protein
MPEEASQVMKKIVILGGMPRSGTNLARRIIGSHSQIAIPTGEFKFFRQYAKGRSIREILANPRLKEWKVDFSDLYEAEPREVFIKTLFRYAVNVGKEIPGEKTPQNEFFYDTLKVWLSDYTLKFIHLVRNPFDALASFKNFQTKENQQQYDLKKMSVHSINWRRSVSLGLARAYQNPNSYYLLKYEDLTENPKHKTKELCDFLGVNFEGERMLNMVDFQEHKDNTSFPQEDSAEHLGHGVIRKSESRKQFLIKPEIMEIASNCGELAIAIGYDDSDFIVTPPERPAVGVVKKIKKFAREHMLSQTR